MNTHINLDGSGYDSHLPVLHFINDTIGIRKVFEYGCGEHSTGFFASIKANVIAYEMQDENWFKKMSENFRFEENIHINYLPGATDAIKKFDTYNTIFDLVFVDGYGETRPWCIIAALDNAADTIVWHDSENGWYGWDRVWKSKHPALVEYEYFEIKKWHPNTAILTRNVHLAAELKKLQSHEVTQHVIE
jgi:hypothetical protein